MHSVIFNQCRDRRMGVIRGVARGGAGGKCPPSAKRTDFFQKTHKNTRKLIDTNSVLAGSGSARHGTVCPPKPKILATPLVM